VIGIQACYQSTSVGTVAACGFAAVLYAVVTSSTVHQLLSGVIEHALHAVA